MKCLYCGKEFTPTPGSVRQKYCTADCRNANGRKMNGYPNVDRFCIVCNKRLIGSQRKYCSTMCRTKIKNKLEAELHKKPRNRCYKDKDPKLTINEIAKRARAEGLSYGQYCAKYGV